MKSTIQDRLKKRAQKATKKAFDNAMESNDLDEIREVMKREAKKNNNEIDTTLQACFSKYLTILTSNPSRW